MTLQDIEKQALQLPNIDKWALVKTLLNDLQQQTDQHIDATKPSSLSPQIANKLSPWVKKLMGIVQLEEDEDPREIYIDYLEKKYS
jgi:hypothetical protein